MGRFWPVKTRSLFLKDGLRLTQTTELPGLLKLLSTTDQTTVNLFDHMWNKPEGACLQWRNTEALETNLKLSHC